VFKSALWPRRGRVGAGAFSAECRGTVTCNRSGQFRHKKKPLAAVSSITAKPLSPPTPGALSRDLKIVTAEKVPE